MIRGREPKPQRPRRVSRIQKWIKRRNSDEATPLVGVYLLMLEGEIVYIGSGLDVPARVAQHRSNGRPFDRAFFIATTANEREALELVLIRAIDPPQNRHGRAVVERCSPPVPAGERAR